MATEILRKSRTRIEAQGNSIALVADKEPTETPWNTSGYYYGDTPVTLDNTYDGGSENCQGADYLQLELDVTTAPTTAGTAQIWYRGSEDGTNYTKWKYSHTVGDDIATSIDRYDGGLFALSYQYTQLAVVAIDYAFNADLLATPKLYEIAS